MENTSSTSMTRTGSQISVPNNISVDSGLGDAMQEAISVVKDQKGGQPTALEVIEELTKQNDEMPSKYMQGHISKQIIEDTFLVDAQQKFPESSIRINCEPHNAPAVFFSKQQNQYKCFKCLVGEQDLVYIDKRFKKEMEDFEDIKNTTKKAVVDNAQNTALIKEWKQSIRKTLIEVKENFIDWIDNFTNKFVKSLNKIEQSRELIEFAGEDKRLTLQVLDIQNKYLQIVKIFGNI